MNWKWWQRTKPITYADMRKELYEMHQNLYFDIIGMVRDICYEQNTDYATYSELNAVALHIYGPHLIQRYEQGEDKEQLLRELKDELSSTLKKALGGNEHETI